MAERCEACERVPFEIIEPCDNAQVPYRLCKSCHVRLREFALRPVEWYNLAKRHGWSQFSLHDDFYLDDGSATQPEMEVEEPERFPAPSLREAARDPEALLDYSITRWKLEAEVVDVWLSIPREIVNDVLSTRFHETARLEIRAIILGICAAVLGDFGADFVRQAWKKHPKNVPLVSLAKASAACLPPTEGFYLVTDALSRLHGSEKRDCCLCLGFFHSTDALNWIEQNIFEPIMETWGNLAAASKMDWNRIETWIQSGRPLSLVAIDAMLAIAKPATPYLRDYGPTLGSPPTIFRFQEVLTSYRQRDPVPRVEKRIDALLADPTALVLVQ